MMMVAIERTINDRTRFLWIVMREHCSDLQRIQLGLYFASRKGAKYCDHHVCMSVCLSVRSNISETTWPNFTTFLPVAVTRSDDNFKCYVIPVLLSYNGGNRLKSKTTRMFCPIRQTSSPVGRQITLFGRDRRWQPR